MKDELTERIAVARGIRKADLVLKGGSVLNVFSGELQTTDVAIAGGRIAGLGAYAGKKTLNVSSRVIVPGFIDSHVHIESSMLAPARFAEAVIPGGTTAVIADPHEIANVLGSRGIRFMLKATARLPLDVYFMLPSSVPASRFDTAGARLTDRDLLPFLVHERVLGLAEMMDVPGLLDGDPGVLRKLAAFRDRTMDGHAPGLSGRDLNAYRGAGIGSDHECTTAEEAREKVGLGMTVFIREGSAARNLEALLPAVTQANSRFFCFATDDVLARDAQTVGIRTIIKKSVRLGLDALSAVRMATINPARHFGLRDRGAVAPGFRADLLVLDDLRHFTVLTVFKDGKPAAQAGTLAAPLPVTRYSGIVRTVHTRPVAVPDLRLKPGAGRARVIELVPDRIETRQRVLPVIVDNGMVANGPDRDIAKLVVVERHRASGRIGIGLVRGFGLRAGAFASTVAHDAHNIIAAGTSDAEIAFAIREIRRMQGGLVAVRNGKVAARLPLPIAGLMSDKPVAFVAKQQEKALRAVRELGVTLPSPFATLSFLALPVIPELKLTDRGLVDVKRGVYVDLFL